MPQNEVTTTNRDWEIAIVRANALHGQITGLTGQIQTLEQKRWMTAVVLGGLLARMKAAAQHGEWKALFTKNDTCVVFDKRTAQRYMKLYREVLKRARKLGTVDVALIESGRRDARTLEEIGKLSDADSLRQAYFDFGVVTPPKSHGFQASGNPDGRPAREKETDPDAELAEARKLATYAGLERVLRPWPPRLVGQGRPGRPGNRAALHPGPGTVRPKIRPRQAQQSGQPPRGGCVCR